jgi:hypothetical protein
MYPKQFKKANETASSLAIVSGFLRAKNVLKPWFDPNKCLKTMPATFSGDREQ